LAKRKNLEGEIIAYRTCLDPRTLNKQLVDVDIFPIPIISDILEKVSGHNYFTTIDLSQAYHRLPLDESSRPYTAFKYNNKQYMFARAPFGLKPMTSIFQRGMSHILGDLHYVSVYVDDIVIFSKTIEEHMEHVKTVVNRLTKAKLIINREKSNFLRTQVILLGFVVDANGRRINPHKVANISSWAPPTNGKMIQRYLGMFNYFREYIPLYSTIAAPLDKLRNKKGNFQLTDLELNCFNSLKNMVGKAPVLSFPDFKSPFYVATDASNLGIGAVLYQLPNGPDDESKVNYISFMARSLHQSERNYPAYKKELLAIIYACKKFHYYIWGRKFTLFTDHKPLTFINDQKELPQTLADWKHTLFSYDFLCIYRPGMLNIIPDALSRAFPEDLWIKPRFSSKASNPLNPTVAAIALRSHKQSDNITVHSDNLLSNVRPTYIHEIQTEEAEKIIPNLDKQKELLQEVHNFGHPGTGAMIEEIQRKGFTWPKLRESCAQWIQRCSACQHFNIARRGYHPLKAIHATLPGEHIAIDLAQFPVSSQGNMYVLLVVDICNRFVFLEPIANKEATTIASVLFKLFCSIGFPKIIQSDNGTEFVNAILKNVTTKLSIEHRLTTPYHPRANGVAERHVRTFKETLQKELNGNIPEWDTHIPMIQLQMNVRIANLHSSTPFSLFYGRSFAGISDFSSSQSHLLTEKELEDRLKYLTDLVFPAISKKSKETQRKMVDRFNSTHLIMDFPIGSFVMVRDPIHSGALDPKYEGPFKVIRRTTHGTYTLMDKTNSTIPRNFAPEQLKLVTQALDGPDDSEDHYEIEAILSHNRTDGGEILYKVKWKGYDEISDIPYEAFNSKATVNRYYKKLNLQNPHNKRKANDSNSSTKKTRRTN